MSRKGDFTAWVRGESAGTPAAAQRKHDKDEVQRRSGDAVDAHQGESSEAGAVVEVFQFRFRRSPQGQCTDTHSKEPVLLKMCTKSDGHVWPCRLPLLLGCRSTVKSRIFVRYLISYFRTFDKSITDRNIRSPRNSLKEREIQPRERRNKKTCNDSSIGSCVRASVTEARVTVYVACICQENVYVKEKMCLHTAVRCWQLSKKRQCLG